MPERSSACSFEKQVGWVASCSRRFEHGLRLFRPKAGIFGLFGRISINFAAVWGVILLFLWNFLILFKFFRNFKFFRRKCCLPPFSRRSSFQSRAARAVLKSKLILAFVDADWVGGAAALVQFLRSDNLLARRIIASMEQVALADSRERIDYA